MFRVVIAQGIGGVVERQIVGAFENSNIAVFMCIRKQRCFP